MLSQESYLNLLIDEYILNPKPRLKSYIFSTKSKKLPSFKLGSLFNIK